MSVSSVFTRLISWIKSRIFSPEPKRAVPGWLAIGYMIIVGHCIAYVTWFGAVERLPASVAAIGTMLVPVIGVVVSAIALHEPLGLSQIAALVFTVAGVTLAARS